MVAYLCGFGLAGEYGGKMADTLTLFTSIGLSEQKAKETLKNEVLSSVLKDAISQVMLRPQEQCGETMQETVCRCKNMTGMHLAGAYDLFFLVITSFLFTHTERNHLKLK